MTPVSPTGSASDSQKSSTASERDASAAGPDKAQEQAGPKDAQPASAGTKPKSGPTLTLAASSNSTSGPRPLPTALATVQDPAADGDAAAETGGDTVGDTGGDTGNAAKPAAAEDKSTTAEETAAAAPAKEAPAKSASASGSSRLPGYALAAGVGAGVIAVLTVLSGMLFSTDSVPATVDDRLSGLETRLDAAELGTDNLALAQDLRRDLEALQSDVEALRELPQSVERLRGAVAMSRGGAEGAEAVARLQGGLDALNRTLQETETRMAQLSGEVTRGQARLEGRLTSLETATPSDLPDQLASLDTRVGTLESNDVARDARRAALAVALANLTRASQSARPFAPEYRALDILVEDADLMAALKPYADTGLPTVESLGGTFDAVSREVVRVHDQDQDLGVFGRLWRNIRATVSVRPTGELEGQTPPAVVARAERRLAEGNLLAAVQEVVVLEDRARTAATPWLSDAKARLDLDRLIARLNARVIESIAAETAGAR